MSRNRLVFMVALVCMVTAMTPLSDFDFDGNPDSFVTEGLAWIPWIGSVTGLFSLWTKLPAACLAVSQQFSSLILPPPIYNR